MSLSARPALHRNFHRLAWFAMIMTASTIMFGAFVRLSDAGLSCPDWPTCYGQATWPQHVEETIGHPAAEIRPLETHKAWREQVHRFLAGALGIEILTLALLATRKRRFGTTAVVTACVLVAAGIPLYMMGWHGTASALALVGEAILLIAALRWSNIDLARAALLTLAVVIFQALLGMWTVTLLLKPIVVMGHLLGGMLMFALLAWMAWRATHMPITLAEAPKLKWLLRIGLAVLVTQIALGGWVSANYAALACGGGSASLDNFRAVPTSGGRSTTSLKASPCGVASAWTTKAACWMAPRVSPSRWRTACSRWWWPSTCCGWACACSGCRACAAGPAR